MNGRFEDRLKSILWILVEPHVNGQLPVRDDKIVELVKLFPDAVLTAVVPPLSQYCPVSV